MADVARPGSLTTGLRDMARRIATLERAATHPGVDTLARSSVENAAALAANAAALAENSELLAQNAEELAQNAEAVAAAAQSTADGKNAVYRQATAPTGGTYAVNDLWFDTDDGYRVWTWNGSAWTQNLFGSAAISDVSASAIAGQLTSNQIAQLNADKIAGQLTSGQIASVAATVIAGQLAAGQIAAEAITSEKLAANAVIAAKIDAGAITSDKLFANAVTTEKINALAITSEKINANAVVAEKINANAVTAEKINANAVTADKIFAGAVVADKIAANAVTAAKIEANAMTAKNFYTAADGTNRIIMGPTAYFTEPRIVFDYTGNGAGASDPSLRATSSGLQLHGGSVGSNATSITMGLPSQPDRILMSASTPSTTVTAELDATINRFTVSGTINAGANIASGTNRYFVMGSTTYSATVNSTANVHVTGSGDATQPFALRHTTASSRAYKRDIDDLTEPGLDPARLYDLPVRQFKFRDDYIDPNDPYVDQLVPGFIAQEVAEHYPIAASRVDGEPEDWNPRLLIPPMLALIQDLHGRVVELETALAGGGDGGE